ncbi:MAG: sodium:solute symporter family protein [Alphaproteobacteria bacterium]|nr:sodium:solute symporter family protein [Alphaproteobacteria bacterium]
MDPFVYQFVLGGAVFGAGMLYAYAQGYLSLSGEGLRNLVLMVGGLALIAAVQGYLQYAPMTVAPEVAYDGPPIEKRVLGTPLDYGIMVAYFLAMLFVGTFFGRGQTSTKDFFFAGQRFSWWLIAVSLVATTIGSYSFVKYSKIAFGFGLASTQTYLNDWFWLPLLLFGWLPILYFGRLTSIPEYFEHRFGPTSRRVVTAMLLVYLVGYVGINLFTMGAALHVLLGVDVLQAAIVVAVISAIYVTFGGQTSVIMTDLFQGLMLLATGLVILALGADRLGGFDMLWVHLPRSHRMAFPPFNADPAYPAVGIFWQDAIANSAMFYFLNQGILMRFMAARSVREGRRAAIAVLALLMPLAAMVVASGGWVGRSFVHAGLLPDDIPGDDVFFVVAEMLAMPGVFGLIMAALTAALMSTVDSLITAIAAIVVNDVYRPIFPKATEAEQLRMARIASVAVTLIGVLLVPVFAGFDSIYAAHGAFTAAITPPMVVALLFGVFWRRFTPAAALATMIGAGIAIAHSIFFPEVIAPFAHGVPMKGEMLTAAERIALYQAALANGDFGVLLEGAKAYKFMRAFYGLVWAVGIGVIVTMVTKPRSLAEIRGYVWGTVPDALRRYKGSDGTETYSAFVAAETKTGPDRRDADLDLPAARLSSALAVELTAGVGDLVYVCDRRAWLGGLRSRHCVVSEVVREGGKWIEVPAAVVDEVGRDVRVQRMY